MLNGISFNRLTSSDLPELVALQPEGWSDITLAFDFYVRSSFCSPFKLVENHKILGVGCAIVHGKTAWLGHIIVAPDQRGKGFGSAITKLLIEDLRQKDCETIMLIATKLGEPVYRKVGFVTESTYTFLNGNPIGGDGHSAVKKFDVTLREELLSLDREIVGEDRSKLIIPKLDMALVYVAGRKLVGYYLPGVGDGPIIANEEEAGKALLIERSKRESRSVIPVENETALIFLMDHGYQVINHGTRMRLGEPFAWHPKQVYNRIGGNVG